MSLLQAGFGSSGGDYTIDDSLRFRSAATAYLSRTPASATNQKTWTWSGWVKRSNIAANGQLFTARTAVSGTYFGISFQGSGDLRIECNLETAYPLYKTNALFRDPSAWYHIVVALDMTQATSTNRLKVYINGVLQTTASYNVPAQNTDLNVNSTATHLMGQQASGQYLDGYLTEVNFIDGQALAPTDFGEFDDNGTWKPLEYTGTYGTNGFYLPMTPTTQATGFNTVLYTGNGGTQSITGVGFTPDLVIGKGRTYAGSGLVWYDSVRGATKWIGSYSTAAETTVTGVTSFDADGFSVGSSAVQNLNTSPYVAWNWLASNTTASNTVGSITSTVSVNTTSGFSIVSYTGTGSAATVGHGLGVAPSMMIIKTRSAVNSWVVYHQSLGNTKAIYLNLTGAADTNASFWNNTSPTSSVLTVNTDTICNQNGTTYVGYCFAEVPGYSAFGSYTGNGSTDGTFVYTGFRPAWVMIKSSSSAGDSWFVLDSKRTTTNVMGDYFRAESTNAEATTTALDLLSNGFKLRTTSGAFNDATTFIYMAFAENPFKNANAR